MRLRVTLDGLTTARDRLRAKPRQIKRAEVRSVNKTIRGVRAGSSKRVREHYALRATAIKERTTYKNANRSQKLIRGYVYYSDRGIPLEEYGRPRQGKKGVSVTIEKSEGRTLFRHAFFRPDKPGIWKRIPAGGGKLVPRTPIRRLWGPSLASIIKRDLLGYITRDADATLLKRFREELNYEILKERR